MAEKKIGIIILAGGESRKLGTPKQLVEYKGTTLLRRTTEVALACACNQVVVVLGSRADEIHDEIRDLAVETVTNYAWKDGISTSLKKGLAKLDGEISAAVIMLSDQPFVTEQTIHLFQGHLTQHGRTILGQRACVP